jgi:hypothetical protein
MPMVYRTNPALLEEERQENAVKNRKGPQPISTLGAGRSGALMAFTTATGVANGR